MKRALAAIVVACALVTFAACQGQTNAASGVTHEAATLHASLSCDRGERGEYWAEYRRLDTSAWTQLGRRTFDCGAGGGSREEAFALGGLHPSTGFEFRVCADLTQPDYGVLCGDSAGTPHGPGDTGGRAYHSFTTRPSPPPGFDVALPARAAFYYPWFPETWTVNGRHVFYHPKPGYYDSSNAAVADAHISQLRHGGFDVAIASWWGQGTHAEQTRLPLLLDRTSAASSGLKWTLYYEKEGSGNPTVAALQDDLSYIHQRYADRPEYARVGGKPVLFVYNANDTTCEVANRWRQAVGPSWYLVLKVFPGYRDCAQQPNAWHQYAPAAAASSHDKSYAISPGFHRADEPLPRLERDPTAWPQRIRDMVASGKPWQLVTTFNEWGEGTAVEPAQEWESPSGYGTYLDALNSDGTGGAG